MPEYHKLAGNVIDNNHYHVCNYLDDHIVESKLVNKDKHECKVNQFCSDPAGKEREISFQIAAAPTASL